ncbi:MAG TPA: hypothetical protein PKH33_18055, partial [bacterium]|nr:hypothetical protein [bacterium]
MRRVLSVKTNLVRASKRVVFIAFALSVVIAACAAAQESRGSFNEDVTLGDSFATQTLNIQRWEATGDVALESDGEDYSAVVRTSSIQGASSMSMIGSRCSYDFSEGDDIIEASFTWTRAEEIGEDPPNDHVTVLFMLANAAGGSESLALVFRSLRGNELLVDNEDAGQLALVYLNNGEMTNIDSFSTCSAYDEENMRSEGCEFLFVVPIARIPFNAPQHFRIRFNNSFGRMDVFQNGVPMMSYSELGVLMAKGYGLLPMDHPDYISVMSPIAFPFKLAFGQITQETDSIYTPDRSSEISFGHYNTTLSRACNGEREPSISDATPVRAANSEYQKMVGSSVGVDSGNLTVSVSPPSVRILGDSYAPALTYHSGSVNVRQLLDIRTGNAPSHVPPDTQSMEIKFRDLTQTYIVTGSSDDESRFAVLTGEDEPLETGVYFYRVRTSYDYQGDDLRLGSAYGNYVPVLSLDTSPYGRGWYPADIEQLYFPHEDIIISSGAGGDIKAYIEHGSLWMATSQVYITEPELPTQSYHMLAFSDENIIVTSPVDGSVISHYFEYFHGSKTIKLADSYNLGLVPGPGQPARVDGYHAVIPSFDENTLYSTCGNPGCMQKLEPLRLRQMIELNLSGPTGAASKGDKILYVANYTSNNIIRIDFQHNRVDLFAGDITKPRALVLDGDILYALHSNRGGVPTISAFDVTAPFPATSRHTVMTFNFALNLSSMSLGADHKLYVVDSWPNNARIYRVYPEIGVYHPYVNDLAYPVGVAVTPGEFLFTGEASTNRLLGYGPKEIYHNGPGDWSYITKDPADNYTKHFKHGIKWSYDSRGLLKKKTDRNDNSYRFTYDSSDRLTDIYDPTESSSSWSFHYSGGCVQRITYHSSRETGFLCSGGDLAGIAFPDGLSMGFSYNSKGQMRTKTDVRGKEYRYEYGDSDRISAVNPPGDGQYAFNPAQTQGLLWVGGAGAPNSPAPSPDSASPSGFTDLSGNEYTYKIDRFGQLMDEVGPLSYGVSVTRDPQLNPIVVKSPDGVVSVMKFDERGNLVYRTNPRGMGAYQYEYEPVFDFPTREIDPLNRETVYEYDHRGNLVRVTDPLGQSVSYTYDSRGLPSSFTDQKGNKTDYSYNDKGNVQSVSAPCGGPMDDFSICVTQFAYDSFGNTSSITNPRGYSSVFTHDPMNRRASSKDALERVTIYEYYQGMLTAVKLPYSIDMQRVTSYEYDDPGRLVSVTDPMGVSTSYEYDVSGNVVARRACCGRDFSYVYDELGRVTRETMPIGFYDYSYDASGRLASVTDALGRVASYTYNHFGDVTAVAGPGDIVSEYGYDAMGNLIGHRDPNGNLWHYQYDALDRFTAFIDPLNAVTSYTYDSVDNMVSVTDPTGRSWTYEHTPDGLVHTASDPLGAASRYAFDKNGNIVKHVDALDLETSYEYDKLDRVVSIVRPDDKSLSYSYNIPGFLVSSTDSAGRLTSFHYDLNGNMLSRRRPGYQAESFTYNDAGLMTSFTKKDGHSISIVRDAMLRPVSVSAQYDYTGSSVYFELDVLGRAVSANNAVSASSFTYDPAGRASEIFDTVKSGGISGISNLNIAKSLSFDHNGNITAMNLR